MQPGRRWKLSYHKVCHVEFPALTPALRVGKKEDFGDFAGGYATRKLPKPRLPGHIQIHLRELSPAHERLDEEANTRLTLP
jgi:hypothetical protein